ncbi:MAG: stage III sporulation protein AG [Eubacterium sp.]|nr:stage III sporulation protein AG [Eubacterium sp.]
MEEIKKLIKKAGPMKLGIVLLCGILLILLSYGKGGSAGEKNESETGVVPVEDQKTDMEQYKIKREQELKELLQKVDGVGKVEVMLTLKGSNEKVTLKDNTYKGEDTEEETVLIEDSDRNSSPYILQEKEPEVEGVVIVCEGGEDAATKREISEAVCALFQIESHKIKILKCA